MNRLRTIFNGDEQILVNSFHHQAVKEVAPGFRATATAPDGINEAMEHTEKTIFGVQWHPEAMAPQGDEAKPYSLTISRMPAVSQKPKRSINGS